MNKKKPTVLVMTSTYPRWEGDSTPIFVQQYARALSPYLRNVYILAPHAHKAHKQENEKNISVQRYRYFFPTRWQNIVYEGGGVGKITKTPLYAIKLVFLVLSLFSVSVRKTITRRVQIINPHWIIPQGFVAVIVKLITRKKIVLTVHGSDIFGLTGKIMTAIKRFTLKHCDVVCVNSEATKRACEKVYEREYIVIPMGVNTELFKETKPSKALAKKQRTTGFTILFVGRLTEIKGVKYLCEALKDLHKREYDFKAIIIGDGPQKKELEEYVVNNKLAPKVMFAGWLKQEELSDYYSIADVFVGPSLSEAQGIVFLEALATGTPVIASRVGGIPDIVKDGVNGYLVKPRSGQKIREKLEMLINDKALRERLSKNAKRGIIEKYSWENVAREYSSVFRSQL